MLACVLALPALVAGAAAQAAPVAVPNTFKPDTPAKAAEVNADFDALENAINTQLATIAAQQSTIATLQTSVAALRSQLSSMDNVVALNNVV